MSFDAAIRQLRKDKQMSLIARKLGVSRAAVYDWERVPPNRVLAVSRITGLPLHFLRPDLYPKSFGKQSNGGN